MRTWTLRFRVIDRDNFNEIKYGLKTVETRANTERYANVKTRDILLFVCGKDRLRKKIRRVRRFKTIAAMTRAISYKKIMPSVSSIRGMREVYYGYPNYKEKIKKFGIVAMGF